MTPRVITIYEVAQAAGVSISTVSNALNRPDRVGDLTRARVLEVADELGYVPKAQAVSNARKAMRRIGVVAPFTSYASYLERLAGVLAEAGSRGIEVSVFDHESAATASSPVLAGMPIQGQVDGLIVMGMRIEDVVERRLFERGLPTVVVDTDSDRFPAILCEDVSGGRMAAQYLYALGHRRFGYILEQQTSDYESQAVSRLTGFSRQLEEFGDCELVVRASGSSVQTARDAALALLAEPGRPTALMAHFDALAVGALLAARDLAISVPDDISVMGYDDGAEAVAADLTTVRQPFRESGATAMRMLVSAIEQGAGPRTVTYLDVEVVERSTTGALQAGTTTSTAGRAQRRPPSASAGGGARPSAAPVAISRPLAASTRSSATRSSATRSSSTAAGSAGSPVAGRRPARPDRPTATVQSKKSRSSGAR